MSKFSKADTVQPYLGFEWSGEFDRWLDDLREQLAVENWRNIGATGNPAFTNSWANSGGSNAVAAFYRDPFRIVRLKGVIDTGTSGTSAFTLPVGYRPSEVLQFPALQTAGAAGAWITVNTDGTVVPTRTGAAIHLTNVTFRV
jgi:hypothetical protein